ncbi:MAG: GNAT family N-acetyltransferase [Chloroflexota bacterium]
MPIFIRLAGAEDAPAIGAIHVRSWEFAYRGLMPGDYLDGLVANVGDRIQRWRVNLSTAGPEGRCWAIERDGPLVGFASTGPSRDSDAPPMTGEVMAIYLAPEVIGTGVGRGLFAYAVQDLLTRGFSPLTLWVLASNQRARRFYETAGWLPDGASGPTSKQAPS